MVKKFFFPALLVLAGAMGNIHAADVADEVEILKQGDGAVTLADVDGFLQRMPENQRMGFLDSPDRVQQMLIHILREKQLANQALALKLDQEPGVRDEIAYSRNQILARRRMDAFVASLKIPSMEATAKEQYLVHKADYSVSESVVVQHILISEKDRTDADAKALAEKVRAEALANPGDFDRLVDKYSDDPSKVNNLGIIRDAASDKKVVLEFALAAKNLKTSGEISPVVKTVYGYHILKLISKTPAKQQSFDDVKGQLIAKLKDDYINEQRRAYATELDDAKASVNDAGMQALVQRYHLGETPSIGEAIEAAKAKAAEQGADKK